jgi:cold shock CspA family protein
MDFFGTVVAWHEAGGFGFIRLPDNREIFFHRTVVQRAGLGDSLPVGSRVEIDVEKNPRDGRLRVSQMRKAFGATLSERAAASDAG